jgi:hypothetical protein
LVGDELALREREGGHTSVPNFPTFFDWVSASITAASLSAFVPSADNNYLT